MGLDKPDHYGDEMLLIAVAITKTIIFYIWDISITVTVSTITRLITAISFMVFYITILHNLLIFLVIHDIPARWRWYDVPQFPSAAPERWDERFCPAWAGNTSHLYNWIC